MDQAATIERKTGYMPTSEHVLFGRALSGVRRDHDLSQSALARALGVNHSYISRLEAGQRSPSLDLINRIEAALNLNDEESRLIRRAAGYLRTAESLVLADPLMMALARALNDTSIPEATREAFRAQIAAMIEHAGGYVGGDR